MKQFLSFVRKEFRQIFRDRRTLLILLIMPLMLVLLLGYAIKTELNDARVAVFDPSKDTETRRVIERLQASEYFTVVRELVSPDEIGEVFKSGDIGLVVVFSERFASDMPRGEASIQLIADGTDPNQASLLTSYAQGVLSSYQAELLEQSRVPTRIDVVTRMLYNPQGESAYNFVPGVMGVVLMLFFVGILWRDINRGNRYRRELERTNREKESLLAAREQLMLAITHDIKAPLGSVMGYIDLLSRLPEHLAEPLRLRCLEGLNSTQIAERLHMPAATVRTRLRAAAMLMKKWKGEGKL